MRLALLTILALACQPEPETDKRPEETGTEAQDGDADGYPVDDDCDDADAAVNPGADELCNGIDDDCDGGVDLGASDATRWYDDDDADGYGSEAVIGCEQPAGAVTVGGDCHDLNAAISPEGVEVCNGADDDCDGTADEAGTPGESTWYPDADGDGHGDEGASVFRCDPGAGYLATAGDCDDTSALALPGGTEVCGDGLDNDCSGEADACVVTGTYAPGSHDVQFTGVAAERLGSGLVVGDFDGDGQADLVGGAPGHDADAPGAGAVSYWYGPVTGESAAGSVAALLPASGLGATLAAGDHDGDGIDDLFAHAPRQAESTRGAVYLLYGGPRIAGATDVTGVPTLEGTDDGDTFGAGLALGDLDGDGVADVVVGAVEAADGGGAYVFYGSMTRRADATSATGADAAVAGIATGDTLGRGVAIVRDMNGDGLGELLVGAPGVEGAATDVGAAYLFVGDAARFASSLPPSAADATFAGTAEGDNAGEGVHDLGDLDGDGYGDAGVSGSGYDADGLDAAGAVWVYAGGTTIAATPVATVQGAQADSGFGAAFASPGDLDGDGTADLLVGSPYDATGGVDAGATFLFYGPVVGTLAASDAAFYGSGGAAACFGGRVATSDLTGDGFADIVVGADGEAEDAGAIYVWAGLGGE